ncbi:hypothetical protein CC80DRAFT_553644 [Byssothecium circinans]|uniref:Uncharacterized protein n=1 Tax=Byssothecium circinans TaxID=147558 RepID=A0A6A5TGL2_9PLEO|nr:hypothetical protein CC80DRAFT_553644 [Byssothecium circinans]
MCSGPPVAEGLKTGFAARNQEGGWSFGSDITTSYDFAWAKTASITSLAPSRLAADAWVERLEDPNLFRENGELISWRASLRFILHFNLIQITQNFTQFVFSTRNDRSPTDLHWRGSRFRVQTNPRSVSADDTRWFLQPDHVQLSNQEADMISTTEFRTLLTTHGRLDADGKILMTMIDNIANGKAEIARGLLMVLPWTPGKGSARDINNGTVVCWATPSGRVLRTTTTMDEVDAVSLRNLLEPGHASGNSNLWRIQDRSRKEKHDDVQMPRASLVPEVHGLVYTSKKLKTTVKGLKWGMVGIKWERFIWLCQELNVAEDLRTYIAYHGRWEGLLQSKKSSLRCIHREGGEDGWSGHDKVLSMYHHLVKSTKHNQALTEETTVVAKVPHMQGQRKNWSASAFGSYDCKKLRTPPKISKNKVGWSASATHHSINGVIIQPFADTEWPIWNFSDVLTFYGENDSGGMETWRERVFEQLLYLKTATAQHEGPNSFGSFWSRAKYRNHTRWSSVPRIVEEFLSMQRFARLRRQPSRAFEHFDVSDIRLYAATRAKRTLEVHQVIPAQDTPTRPRRSVIDVIQKEGNNTLLIDEDMERVITRILSLEESIPIDAQPSCAYHFQCITPRELGKLFCPLHQDTLQTPLPLKQLDAPTSAGIIWDVPAGYWANGCLVAPKDPSEITWTTPEGRWAGELRALHRWTSSPQLNERRKIWLIDTEFGSFQRDDSLQPDETNMVVPFQVAIKELGVDGFIVNTNINHPDFQYE